MEPDLDVQSVPATLTVTGGTVTGVRQLDAGSAKRWEVTIEPSSGADVSILLAPTTHCEAEGAVCTTDGRKLSVGRATLVTGPGQQGEPQGAALTAELRDVPASHDGAAAFTFELALSEDIAGLSYTAVQGSMLRVTGGQVTRARRLAAPSNERWEVTVEPGGDADVSITLPVTTSCDAAGALCSADGLRKLSEAVSATVPGPACAFQ